MRDNAGRSSQSNPTTIDLNQQEDGDLPSFRRLPSRRLRPVSKRIDMAANISSEDGTQLRRCDDDSIEEEDEQQVYNRRQNRRASQARPTHISFPVVVNRHNNTADDDISDHDEDDIERNMASSSSINDENMLKRDSSLTPTVQDESLSHESPLSFFEDEDDYNNKNRDAPLPFCSCICTSRWLLLIFSIGCFAGVGAAAIWLWRSDYSPIPDGGAVTNHNSNNGGTPSSAPTAAPHVPQPLASPATTMAPDSPGQQDGPILFPTNSGSNNGQRTQTPAVEQAPDDSFLGNGNEPGNPQDQGENTGGDAPDEEQGEGEGEGGGGGGIPPIWHGRNPNNDLPNFEFSPYLVGAYYYPWHKRNFHNNEGYIRRELQPTAHLPVLGEYDDSQPEVIAQHFSWSRQANIGLWATSWWGPGHVTDDTTRDVIMEHEDIGEIKIALHYETNGRLGRRDYDLNVANDDIEYICDRFFGHPAYYRVDGRPVMFLYLARALDRMDLLAQIILTMKRAARRQCGEDIYIIGDHVFSDSPDTSAVYESFMYLDAVTSYDVYGSMGRPSGYAGQAAVDDYYAEQENWRRVSHLSGCRYIPAVSPGYNDRGVRLGADHPALSRRLTADAEEGSLFAYQISKAKELVDPIIDNIIMVNSFNEWHEDTQIEPVLGDPATQPLDLTQGLEYVGYDDLYLNILRRETLERRGDLFDSLYDTGD